MQHMFEGSLSHDAAHITLILPFCDTKQSIVSIIQNKYTVRFALEQLIDIYWIGTYVNYGCNSEK